MCPEFQSWPSKKAHFFLSFCNFNQGLVRIILEEIQGIAAFLLYCACAKRCGAFEAFLLGVEMSSTSAFRRIPTYTHEQAKRWACRLTKDTGCQDIDVNCGDRNRT